jgi:hypothetical protein
VVDALIMGDYVLLGAIVLEQMDLVVDCARGRLVPNVGTWENPCSASEAAGVARERRNAVDRQELDALLAQITALEAKLAEQAASLRALRLAEPAPAPARSEAPALPPPVRPLRPERAALYRIAMLCKGVLASPTLLPETRPYFLQIAEVCREMVQRQPGDG